MRPFGITRRIKELNRAKIIRATLTYRNELLAIDPWLPFPQNACCYGFGIDSRPLPIGALFILWDKWPAITGVCPVCEGRVYGYGFGGLLSIGGVIACCTDCGQNLFRGLGGFATVADLVRPILKETPYYLHNGMFGGCVKGDRHLLLAALRDLGAPDLPNSKWASESEKPAAKLEIQT